MPAGSDSVQSRFRVESEPSERTAIRVYALSFHADYRCRHSGACCSGDWDVPVELQAYGAIADALRAGRIRADSPFVTVPAPLAGAAAVLRREKGACVFFEHDSRLCAVHRTLGEPALPSACRHFPRIALRDARGTFITLSHFCPTAAAMLFRDDVELGIVEKPPAFPDAEYEGLSATDAWPPLLHPRMLMDLNAYSAWERHAVARCGDTASSPETVIATLARDAARLATWKPGPASLAGAVAGLPATPRPAPVVRHIESSVRLRDEVVSAVPPPLQPARDDENLAAAFLAWVLPAWDDFRAPLNRYLAAKVFASWCAYQGRGLSTIVRSLEASLAVVRVEAARQCRDAGRMLDRDLLLKAIRASDFLLNHLATQQALADVWGVRAGSDRGQTGVRVSLRIDSTFRDR